MSSVPYCIANIIYREIDQFHTLRSMSVGTFREWHLNLVKLLQLEYKWIFLNGMIVFSPHRDYEIKITPSFGLVPLMCRSNWGRFAFFFLWWCFLLIYFFAMDCSNKFVQRFIFGVFVHVQMSNSRGFVKGVWLEVVNPLKPSEICVASVRQVRGRLMWLTLEGKAPPSAIFDGSCLCG